jgi:hypothetical protein
MEKEETIIRSLKGFDTIIAVGTLAISSFELMMKAFKWYEKRHGKNKKEDYSRPIIKGI